MQQFFVFGFNKSGTTFLQQLLDSHPRANCPPEHHFNTIYNGLNKLFEQYEGLIQQFDQNTGQQGLRWNRNHMLNMLAQTFCDQAMTFGADSQTSHIGLNDNSIALNLPYFAGIFPQARFLGIVRDPREVCVSLYHYKRKTEPAYLERNAPISAMAGPSSSAWQNHMSKVKSYEEQSEGPARLHIVRYEDLIGSSADRALQSCFEFLGLDCAPDLVEEILEKNRLSRKKDRAVENGFLRSGRVDSWRGQLSPEDVALIEATAGPLMQHYGYKLERQKMAP